ncbi:hypothetical protein GGH91_005486 [Coemansia sp. RSA 2671]|uniref:Large ribosomal subunit protein bL32m n=2 Tax=Coemansia TaxID=4863 RepID=A0A9W8GJP7_9FUNG|nr:hypothetical protein LPJ60_003938 [Coemansia sp. RSA 2675]KAJ2026559.1 hypothetical protein IWW57_002997 [Coemansia sp. S610]KAJ2335400.1 hypothetical protein GGH91_005486 [Coemansia sp. RSA 2671]KAJ2386074.1 hypothetical protein H4S02_004026 [Coemansia sp. RSA 2611]KAJ2690076.1 hypothetical protein IWW39_001042 [Coemansia spiralis]
MSLAFQSARSLVRATTAFPRISYTIGAAMGMAARSPLGASLGAGLGLLGDMLSEMILRAVPKQRTSHSKKRKRMATKGLKNRHDLVPCSGCGRPKLTAHICLNCYHDIKRKLKDMKRTEEEPQ